jgi:hypothetical protein
MSTTGNAKPAGATNPWLSPYIGMYIEVMLRSIWAIPMTFTYALADRVGTEPTP